MMLRRNLLWPPLLPYINLCAVALFPENLNVSRDEVEGNIKIRGKQNFPVSRQMPLAGDFLDILESMGLEQHVTGPTHNLGHTLDLIITRQFDSIIKNNPIIGQFFSDHAAILCDLNSIKPEASVKTVTYRNFKSVNIESFKSDLANSALCNESVVSFIAHRISRSFEE